jgi:hypothetical protein
MQVSTIAKSNRCEEKEKDLIEKELCQRRRRRRNQSRRLAWQAIGRKEGLLLLFVEGD